MQQVVAETHLADQLRVAERALAESQALLARILPDFVIERLKAEPGKWTCGSAGTGGITHLAIELFKRETGTDLLHVPYRGAAPATNDLIAGTIQSTILDVPVLLPHIRSGALKALAVTSEIRSPLLPDVPTMKELGFPSIGFSAGGLIAPAKTPDAVASVLEKACATASAAPEYRAIVDRLGAEPRYLPGDQLRKMFEQDSVANAEAIRGAGLATR